jgi:hypothetical protein
MVILHETTGGEQDTLQRRLLPTKMVILGLLVVGAGTQAVGRGLTSENFLGMFRSLTGYTRIVDGGPVAADLVIGEFVGHLVVNIILLLSSRVFAVSAVWLVSCTGRTLNVDGVERLCSWLSFKSRKMRLYTTPSVHASNDIVNSTTSVPKSPEELERPPRDCLEALPR